MKGERKFKILAADVEKANLDVLIHILKDYYAVYPAKTGESCLKKAVEIVPDLILLDVLLPDINGFDVLKRLKSDDLTSSIPVMFITSLSNSEDENRGLQLGAVDFINKPFNSEIVKARIKTQLQLVKHIRRIEEMDIYDETTGMPNRRNFDSQLAVEWARAVRERNPVSLIMMDIDEYEVIFETHGKEYTEGLLRGVSEVINTRLKRQTDVKARYRGTVFAIILPNTPKDGAKIVAEDIKAGVRNLVISGGERVTLSVGISSMEPTRSDPVSNLVFQADRNLYKAKIEGNTICC
ncbi:MAG: diguanylate cyclase [Oscillospiraceae bacterium]|nr:diguanylate cyclase [Oscillospiraceae bacterium]